MFITPIVKKITLAFSSLAKVFSVQADQKKRPLGDVLLNEKIITLRQLQKALVLQLGSRQKLGQIIVAQKYAKEAEVLQAIKKHYGTSISSLESTEVLIRPRPATLGEKISELRIPIRIKLSIAIIFIIWLTILILSFIILARQKEQLYAQTVKLGKVSLNYFTNDARVPLLNDDIVKLNTVIKEASSVEGLLYAIITDREQVIKAHTDLPK
jgi:adenylate cyclase